jgi:hypothetical protein
MSEPSPGDRIDVWPPGTLAQRCPLPDWTFEGMVAGTYWLLTKGGSRRAVSPKSTWRRSETDERRDRNQ